ncbi:acyltransferase family protein [Alteromonas sp. ASW11-130]|uniref:acyltransferase family protein n=1 Tax=Alteromonas sp. ASW11-130 TaxID=3015775 RepID=UPI0022422A3F|nr:acyltransferase [Alteromonas sp. ASW11-130]
MKKIDYHIETLRGVAILLILFLHLSVEREFNSIKSSLDVVSYVFTNIRIPLFTVISGYFYALLKCDEIDRKKLISSKSMRLLVPLYFAILAEFLVERFVLNKNSQTLYENFLGDFFYANGHYWFVQAIFLIFLTYRLTYFLRQKTPYFTLVFFVATTLFYIFARNTALNTNFFSIGGALYLYPYFILGASYRNIQKSNLYPSLFVLCLTLFVSLFIAQFYCYFYGAEELFAKRSTLGILLGITACFTLLSIKFESKFIAWIGGFSFAIYLYQSFTSKVAKVVIFNVFDMDGYLALFLIIALTTALGILVHIVAFRYSLTRRLVLGLTKRKK